MRTIQTNSEVQNFLNDIVRLSKEIKPLVAIRCITYNHEPYICEALDGFVMQQTTFPFVAIVHDDASTDGTAAIIREYAEKYPNIILPIIETENQYSKHDGSIGRILNEASEVTGAKYIALCEGDDYWTDPLKLQKQVEFLETHPECSLCFHEVEVLIEKGLYIERNIFRKLDNRYYSPNEILAEWTIPTASAVFRTEILNLIPCNPKFQVGDNIIWLTCATSGKLYGLKNKMGVYRRHTEGWLLRNDSYHSFKKYAIHNRGIAESFPCLDLPIIKTLIAKDYVALLYYDIKYFNIKSFFEDIKLGWHFSKLEFCRWLLKAPYLKIKKKLGKCVKMMSCVG